MSDGKGIIATRSRRANAGSRLKHLLELEELNNDQESSQPMNDDDENVNLLFQEDEDDQEFLDVSEEENGSNDEENEDEREQKNNENGEELPDESSEEDFALDSDGEPATSRKRSLNEDEMLSDSDLSTEDSDESEGEKELQKQIRSKKRKVSKKQQQVNPKITTRPPRPKTTKAKPIINSDTLLSEARRSSSRQTTVQNKLAVVERLKETEERKLKIKPVIRKQQVELTQEEKLAEALFTEKENILSLNKFKELEYVKKEKQRSLQLSKRKIPTDIIRITSAEAFISPIQEINEAKRLIEMNTKKKDRRGRKKKIRVEEPKVEEGGDSKTGSVSETGENGNIVTVDKDGDVKMEGSEIASEQKPVDELNANKETETAETMEIKENNLNIETSNGSAESTKDQETVTENITEKVSEEEEEKKKDESGILESENVNSEATPVKSKEEADDIETSEVAEKNNQTPETESVKMTEAIEAEPAKPSIETVTQVSNDVEEIKENAETTEKTNEEAEEVKEQSVKLEDSEILPKPEKKVTFVDDNENTPVIETIHDTNEAENEEIEEKEEEKEEEIYEGPVQRVARNTISFIRFNEELSTAQIKEQLFGPGSNLPASHRFKDLENISRIRFEATLQNNLFKPTSEIKSKLFQKLELLPRFGDIVKRIETVAQPIEQIQEEVQLKTESPNGIYLPNGNKKQCFITGKNAVYFHPERGIPYSNVEANKAIEMIESGHFPWTFFSHSGCFLGSKDGRHAKGVPEGFD